MADPAKYKSLSVPREDWEQLGVLATKTNRTRSKMIGRLIRFFLAYLRKPLISLLMAIHMPANIFPFMFLKALSFFI